MPTLLPGQTIDNVRIGTETQIVKHLKVKFLLKTNKNWKSIENKIEEKKLVNAK